MVSPAAVEECDEVDNDCDGEIDEDLLTTVYLDADEDGFGDDANMLEVCFVEPGMATIGGDCDDINRLLIQMRLKYVMRTIWMKIAMV